MKAALTTPVDELKRHSQRFSLPDAKLLAVTDEGDEDASTVSEILGHESPDDDFITDPSSFMQRRSDISVVPPRFLSRSYKFVQLERALTLANLLTEKEDQIKFRHDYRQSLEENKFEEFLQTSYQKLQDHQEKIKQERALKRSQTFTFIDLEKNFLALDPTRDIKVIFLNDSTVPSTYKLTGAHRTSTLSIRSDDDDTIETFYANRFRHLLRNPSRARDEITLFARHASERLQERIPRLGRVPHRVKIVDERERKGNVNAHTLLQMKHKHALSLIAKRRQLTTKMMIQAQKNQTKMERLNFQPPLAMHNPSCCRELLERINQIERLKRPQTSCSSRRTISKTTNYSSTLTTSITPSYSSCSTPFQDALSIHHVDKTAWINYS